MSVSVDRRPTSRLRTTRNPPHTGGARAVRRQATKPLKPVRDSLVADGRHHTLSEVAQSLGITKERARQIEAQALAKVRKALKARGITEQEWFDHLASLPGQD